MIGLTVGLLVLFGISTVILSSSKSRQEIEKVGNQIENGRYAIQVLGDDIRLAGFFADFNPDQDPKNIVVDALPDVCAVDDATLKKVVRLHTQGYDMGSTIPACITDVKDKTDILVIRRLSTCAAGKAGCEVAVDGTSYLQATQCNSELKLASTSPAGANEIYNVSSKVGDLIFKTRTCAAALADLRKYRTHIYFIANNNDSGDGMPTLKRAELDAGTFKIVPLVEGVENMQLSYGIDTTADGIPELFVADPDIANGCADKTCAVKNWMDVMAVDVALLVRNTAETTGFKDTKTYTLNIDSGGNPQVFGPFGDSYKRHAYTSSIQLVNPSGRRE